MSTQPYTPLQRDQSAIHCLQRNVYANQQWGVQHVPRGIGGLSRIDEVNIG